MPGMPGPRAQLCLSGLGALGWGQGADSFGPQPKTRLEGLTLNPSGVCCSTGKPGGLTVSALLILGSKGRLRAGGASLDFSLLPLPQPVFSSLL